MGLALQCTLVRARQRPKSHPFFILWKHCKGKPKMSMRVYFFSCSLFVCLLVREMVLVCLLLSVFVLRMCACVLDGEGLSMACFSFLPWRGEGKRESEREKERARVGWEKRQRWIVKRGEISMAKNRFLLHFFSYPSFYSSSLCLLPSHAKPWEVMWKSTKRRAETEREWGCIMSFPSIVELAWSFKSLVSTLIGSVHCVFNRSNSISFDHNFFCLLCFPLKSQV